MPHLNEYSIIRIVLEKQFALNRSRGRYAFSSFAQSVPPELLDPSIPLEDDEYVFWRPIESAVSNEEILELENFLGLKLPDAYQFFLKQFYFVDLHLGDDLRFFDNKPGSLVTNYKEIIDQYYANLIAKKIIPFAHYRDWGVIGFVMEDHSSTGNYRLGILDHEDGYEKIDFIDGDFLTLMANIEKQIEK